MNTTMKFVFIIILLINLAGLFSFYKLAKLCNLTNSFISFIFNANSTEMKSFIAKIWLFKEINIPNNGEFWLLLSRIISILNIIFIYIWWVIISYNDIVVLVISTIVYVIFLIIMYKQYNHWSKQ